MTKKRKVRLTRTSKDYKMDDIREKLATLEANQIWIKKILSNHLKHHWAITIAILGITGSCLAAMLVIIFQG